MPAEKALALVVRTSDWSETSRIVTLWTREFGKVRALAKGGRRLRSNFEVALDLLGVCSIVVLRKSSGGLDLLTEAQVAERFPRLRTDLKAMYAATYLAELLSDWTEDNDPHPALFDEALAALRDFGGEGVDTGLRLAAFELVLLRELGYSPALDRCAGCGQPRTSSGRVAFSPAGGGVLCPVCRPSQRDCRPLSGAAWRTMVQLAGSGRAEGTSPAVRREVRQVLGQYITYQMGRQPRLLPYLE
jgi:DNA repair protein RecO (recombination protein O)